MNQRETFEPAKATTPGLRTLIKVASPAAARFISVLIAYRFLPTSPITRSPSCCLSGCSGP